MSSKRLGKGINAIINPGPKKNANSSSRSGVNKVKINNIKPNPDQPRRDFDKKSYNFYISAAPDISLKPYLEEPLNNLSKLVKKSSSVILFCEDDQKLLRLKDILKYQKINFQEM